ncbi:sensor histidine kinase [Labedaea rhizosphaerae]|uniref:histidine kinase n=1 Tax=Labedaea rhizosphaerae TaxID=598644 RepID=A0A4R6SJT2_LABRH|nr:HAMP domain-containing sensor histidine kinase [Labedaea rhizosphaerae]TDQ04157.1 signal transduction histidine kinase [Labedaea rhizosphaerae]
MRSFWLRRTVRFRITATSGLITLLVLAGLAFLSGRMTSDLLLHAVDRDLGARLSVAVADVQAGKPVTAGPPDVQVRVLDTAGAPVDGAPAPLLDARDVRVLKSGETLLRDQDSPVHRWLGTVATAPDGSQRLVVAGAGLIGYVPIQEGALRWLLLAALLGAAAASVATWVVVRLSMRPVQRLRQDASRLPSGERLALPEAQDELRELAGALNGLLARRDEAADRLRRFTGDAAHELRNPVASIRVQAEVAVANPDPEFSHEVLSDVMLEAERLSTLVDGLLTLARSDAGEIPAAQPIDVTAFARAAIARLGEQDLRVSLHAPSGSCWVQAAPVEVDMVLDNYLRNALRYARAEVRVSVLRGVGWVVLTVDDDGHGIAREHRKRVFDRFYRVQDDRARSTGGSGLGLALVAEVVHRRGGQVRVSESPAGGARFQARWRCG